MYVINYQVTAEVTFVSVKQHHQYKKYHENKERSVSNLYLHHLKGKSPYALLMQKFCWPVKA